MARLRISERGPERLRCATSHDVRVDLAAESVVMHTLRSHHFVYEEDAMTTPPASLFQRIVEQMPEAVIVSDRTGAIVLWNRGAEIMFGHSAEDAMGQSLDLIIPERFRARHWEGYRTVMSTGVTRYGQELLAVPAIRKDGRRISIEFSIVLLRDDDGAPAGAVAIVRDVTARWEREHAARTRAGADLDSPSVSMSASSGKTIV